MRKSKLSPDLIPQAWRQAEAGTVVGAPARRDHGHVLPQREEDLRRA